MSQKFRLTLFCVLGMLVGVGCSDGRSLNIRLPSELQGVPARVQLRVLDASNGGVCPSSTEEGARVLAGGVVYDESFDASSAADFDRTIGALDEGRQYLFIAIVRDPTDCRAIAYGCQQVNEADSRVEIITRLDTSGVRCPAGQSCIASGVCGGGPDSGLPDGGSPSGCVPQAGGGECCPVEIEETVEADGCGVDQVLVPSIDGASCQACGDISVWAPRDLGTAGPTALTRDFPHGRMEIAIVGEAESTVWVAARERFDGEIGIVSERAVSVWRAPAGEESGSTEAAFLNGGELGMGSWEAWEVAFHSQPGGLGPPLMIGWGGTPPPAGAMMTDPSFYSGSLVVAELTETGGVIGGWSVGAGMADPAVTYQVRGGLAIVNAGDPFSDMTEPRRLVFVSGGPDSASVLDFPLGRSGMVDAVFPETSSFGISHWSSTIDGPLTDERRIIATEDGLVFWENAGRLHYVYPDGLSRSGGQLPVPGIALEPLRYDIVAHRYFEGAEESAVRRHMLVGPSACGFAAQPIVCTDSSLTVTCQRGVDFSGDEASSRMRSNPWTGVAERIALARLGDGMDRAGMGYATAWAARGASGGVEVHLGFLRDTGEMVTEPLLLWDSPGTGAVKGLEMTRYWSQASGTHIAVAVIVEREAGSDFDDIVLLGATLPLFCST